MLYNCLKVIHIISAAMLLLSMAYSYRQWKIIRSPHDAAISLERIQTQTWLIMIPLVIIQLASGFTMMSIQEYDLSGTWVSGSVIGFIFFIGSWFTFIYLMLLSQQVNAEECPPNHRFEFYRRLQSIMLAICGSALLVMIFLMANKT